MATQKIAKEHSVIVIAGKDKGRTGKVLKVLPYGRVLVEGVNVVKKHIKPNPQKGEEGGILEREAPLHVSNVALLNSATRKSDRVGFKYLEDGTKVRFLKSSGEVIDV
ncbi:MAG: 50S ribosomal protein L24 [Coxiella sp. RIFCSPHIGHO2_12_FULL_44_14]|nr:MAG: 50S ribosomal protein L24 [Coxiella sp. RIFCSPHIGHO2_12_FULL_44_14]